MQKPNVGKVRFGGGLILIASLAIVARAALAADSYVPAPPVAAPAQPEHDRHGLPIRAQHSRTRLVDGSGQALWNNPSCSRAPQVDDWQLGRGRYAIIDPPAWLRFPPRSNAWRAVGVISGMHIRFEAPITKTGRVREIVEPEPSVAFGSYCIYEEFYRTPGDPAAGGEAYWSRIEVAPPYEAPNYFRRPGFSVAATHGPPPAHVDNSGWPTPVPTATPRFVGSPSFFPPRPAIAEVHYRTGVMTDWEVGNKAGWAAIRDAAGNTFGYFTGWPMFIDGKQTHCAIAPRRGIRFDPIVCDGGWPADVVIGVTRVRVYYWHDVTPWGQRVEVTDQIIKAP